MTHIVPAVRIIAALMFSAALGGGVATANAAPCQMYLADGQLAPCAPDVVSEKPGEYGGDNDPATRRSKRSRPKRSRSTTTRSRFRSRR